MNDEDRINRMPSPFKSLSKKQRQSMIDRAKHRQTPVRSPSTVEAEPDLARYDEELKAFFKKAGYTGSIPDEED